MKVFENAFSKVYLFRAQSYYDSILKKELSRLEKSNRLKQFPASCTEPMIYGPGFTEKKTEAGRISSFPIRNSNA